MQAQLNAAISMINGYLWDYLIIFILIGAGLYFTFTTKIRTTYYREDNYMTKPLS